METFREPAGKKTVALTFDDGPNNEATADILDILEKFGIVASFFVIGKNVSSRTGAVVRRADLMGCEINSHSYTHSVMPEMSAEQIKSEMDRTTEQIFKYTGKLPKFFRPPYIAVNSLMYECIDLPFICGIGCDDWDDRVSMVRRYNFLTREIPDNCVILLHDQQYNERTVDAVRKAVPVMLAQGTEFVTVSGLFAARGITPRADKEVIYSFATESGYAGSNSAGGDRPTDC